MKTYANIFGAVIFSLLLAACSSMQSGSATHKAEMDDDTVIQVNQPTTLADMLARVPGVFVDDFGPTTTVKIRGGEPLYVLDGIRLGHSYFEAANAVDVNSISAIEVLKDPAETMMYGRDGQYGVVVIHTGFYEREGD